MKPQFIIDYSITMAWCFSDEHTSEVLAVRDRLASEAAITPIHWPLEVTNVRLMAEKRGRITAADSTEFLRSLLNLDIEQDLESSSTLSVELLELGRSQRLTSYDAAYLALALRSQLPLATLDEQLRQAATLFGVVLLGICWRCGW